MDALEIAARNWKVSTQGCAAGQQNRIEVALQTLNGNVSADVRIGSELDAFGFHQLQPSIQNVLLHLEFRNAVSEKPADAIGSFKHCDCVTNLIQLSCGSKSGGARTDNSHLLTRTSLRRSRLNPAFLKGAFNNSD